METSTVKSKVMANGSGKAEIFMDEVQVEEVSSFEYLGALLSKDGSSKPDVRLRIATEQWQWLDYRSCKTITSCTHLWW